MADKKTLIYCTNGYPSDVFSEKVFVDGELTALRRHFDRIILLPDADAGRRLGFADTLPEGVEVDWSLTRDRRTHSRLVKPFYLFHPYVARAMLDVTREARTPGQWIKGMMQAASTITIGRVIKRLLKRNGLRRDDTLLYSIWFLNSADAAARLALTGGWTAATRGHTSDIYDNPWHFRSDAVRDRLLHGLKRVISISDYGRDYLKRKFPEHADRFVSVHLGSTRRYEPGGYRTCDGSETPLELVTVARIDACKRLPLIIEVLEAVARRRPDRRLRWTLIGDGDSTRDRAELLARSVAVKVRNLEVSFAGLKTNDAIQRGFRDNPPQWHMLMSSTEGIPVSMGEAMSYGIPCVTTDVGQTTELADHENSIIFPVDVDVEKCADTLAWRLFDTELQERMSAAALDSWQRTFDAGALASETAGILASLI